MSYKPNTTIYLCTGTGLDYSNSAWMHRYAYSNEGSQEATQWWSALFQWFKAHSIANGYWYYSYTDPSKGYIDIGRTPLSDGSAGESGLGNAGKQAELDNNSVHYSEAIKAIDWIVFANGDGGSPFDVQYCFVDSVTYINHNVARINFTVDAILTYQKYFWLGRCFVNRDMQFNEWQETSGDRESQIPTLENINTMPEAVGANDSDYVFQLLEKDGENSETLEALSFGSYNRMFCSTDVDLSTVQASQDASALPSFEPCESSTVGDVKLGIGVYQVRDRKNDYFKQLGKFNAMEHLLNSYVLPSKVVKEPSAPITFISDLDTVIEDKFKNKTYRLAIPVMYSDMQTIKTDSTIGYKPVNFKCYTSPISYFSVSDKQGSSMEIPLEQIYATFSPTETKYFTLVLGVNITAAPNMPSNLQFHNLRCRQGSEENPFMTLWQVPSYAMTPNGSGYGAIQAEMVAKANGQIITAAVLGSLAIVGAGIVGTPLSALVAGTGIVAKATGATLAMAGTQAAGAVGTSIEAQTTSETLQKIGLPKTVGGLPTNMTSYTMNHAGYEFYWCHLKTDYVKLIDYMFSITGYSQGRFRYPHVNTRKRWCYVKLDTVNIRNIGGDNYDIGGVPFWARNQIEQRLKSGITFWNLRHAMGDSPISDYSSMPDDAIKMKFVKNYGTDVKSEQILDNADHDAGYASDYSDEAME